MALDKTLLAGSSATLVLKLLDGRDMYGYQLLRSWHAVPTTSFR